MGSGRDGLLSWRLDPRSPPGVARRSGSAINPVLSMEPSPIISTLHDVAVDSKQPGALRVATWRVARRNLARCASQPGALRVATWIDGRVDALGIDARSHYFETFWLPVLGPST